MYVATYNTSYKINIILQKIRAILIIYVSSYILAYSDVVAFGELNTFDSVNIRFHFNAIHNNGITSVCQLFGCTTCTAPIMVDDSTSILTADKLYSVARGMLVASAVFIDSLTGSSDYTLVLMLNP